LEWSLENLLAWKDLQRILRTYNMDGVDEFRRMEMVERLYDNHIDAERSKFTLNLKSEIANIMNEVVDGRMAGSKQIKKALNMLNACLQENLTDTFNRFASTGTYHQYVETRELQLQLKSRAEFRSASDRLVEPDSITARKYV
jgi:hypothetical protein